jgi:hypothetical protein
MIIWKKYLIEKKNKKFKDYLLFIILHPFWTKESIRQKVDHGGHIVLSYWQHATNLAKATMFVVYMSSTKVLVWARGRAKQKRSLTFSVFGQTRSKSSSSSTFPNCNPDKASLHMARPSTHLALLQVACCHTETRPKLSTTEHNWCHTSNFHSHMTYPWSANILYACWFQLHGW